MNKNYLVFIITGVLIAFIDIFWQIFIEWKSNSSALYSNLTIDSNWFFYKISLLFKGLIPIANITATSFWNTNIIELIENDLYAHIIMGFISLFIVFVFFRKFKNSKVIFPLMAGLVLLFFMFGFFWGGSQRHWGYFFLLYFMFYWIYSLTDKSKLSNQLFTIILVLKFIGGVITYTIVLDKPFSNSKNVANYVNNKGVGYVVTGFPDFTLTSISYYLEKTHIHYFVMNMSLLLTGIDLIQFH